MIFKTTIIITMQPKKFVDLVYKALGTSVSVIYLIERVVIILFGFFLLDISYHSIIENDILYLIPFWFTLGVSILIYYIDVQIYQSIYDKVIKSFPELVDMNETKLVEEINYMDNNELKVLKEIMYGKEEKEIRHNMSHLCV